MSPTDFAWIVLALPLAGSMIIAFGHRVLPAKAAGLIGTAAIGLAFVGLGRRPARPPRPPGRRAPADRHALPVRVRRDRDPVHDPRRPALGVHVPRRHRGLDADPPLLVRLHGRRRGLPAVLLVPELLRLLDADARPRRQLRLPDRRLGVRRLRLLRADLLLVPARDGDEGGHEGVRDQRRSATSGSSSRRSSSSASSARSTSSRASTPPRRRSRPTRAS